MTRIFIAEPNEKLRTVLAVIVCRAGWEPVFGDPDKAELAVGSFAADPREAIAAIEAWPTDRTPVIYVSVLGLPEETADALNAGAADYLLISDLSFDLVRDKIAARLPRRGTTTSLVRLSEKWRSMDGIPAELDPAAIRRRTAQIRDLVVLSPAARQLVGLVQSESTTVRELVKVISADPGLSAKLLSVANSAFYRGASPFTSIERAIVRIGFSGVRTLALALSVLDRGDDDPVVAKIYEHSVETAALAESLARASGACEPDRAFLAGLLHDVGKAIIRQQFPKEAKRILKWARERDIPGYRIEQRLLAMDHCRIGALVLDNWKISAAITRPIVFHHGPRPAVGGLTVADQKLATIIFLADNLAKAAHRYADEGDHIEHVGFDHAEFLGMTGASIDAAVDSARERGRELHEVLIGGKPTQRVRVVKTPPAVVLVRESVPPVDVLERFLKDLGCAVTPTDAPMRTADVPEDHVIVTSVFDPGHFGRIVAELKEAEGGDRDRLRRHVLVGAVDAARDDLNAARAEGIGAVAHPVSLREIGRLLKRASSASAP